MRLSQCNRKPHNARVEKIMSKTNDASRELTENELDAVSGGVACSPCSELGDLLTPSPHPHPFPSDPPGVLVHEPAHARA